MKYVKGNGQVLSVFQLGTVQLGMDYGLGDNTKKPQKEFAFSVLDKAMEMGVNTLDTANNYGDSEAVIGEWLTKTPKEKRPRIITKIGPFDHSSPEALRADILAQTEKCLKTLKIEQIDILMVHSLGDYEKNPEIVRNTFLEMKKKGIIRYMALSAYSYNDYGVIARSGFDAVQIPINVFDRTQIENGGIQSIADSGMLIFARSVFLQGLVFLTAETLDPRMSFCKPYLERFHELCREFGMSPAVLAASFVLSLPGVTSLVLGCQTPTQVEQNAEMIDKAERLSDEQMEKLREAFINIDPRVINPQKWFNSF